MGDSSVSIVRGESTRPALFRGHTPWLKVVPWVPDPFSFPTTGLSVVAHLDVLLLPGGPVVWPPKGFESGFVVSDGRFPEMGTIVKTWQLGANQMQLLCRGAACEAWEKRGGAK